MWRKHRASAARVGQSAEPATVAELGPGATLGVGVAALLAGVTRYVALDVERLADPKDTLRVFEEMVEILRSEFHPVDPERVRETRARVQAGLSYIVPWDDPAVVEPDSVDFLISHAVMEHVADIEATYAAAAQWLRPGGVMSHQIDFRSHGTAVGWNGHWAYSQRSWRFYGHSLINRAPLSRHLDAMRRAGFAIQECTTEVDLGGIPRQQLHEDWQELSDDDLTTAGALIVASTL